MVLETLFVRYFPVHAVYLLTIYHNNIFDIHHSTFLYLIHFIGKEIQDKNLTFSFSS